MAKKSMQHQYCTRDPKNLAEYARNSRTHSNEQINQISASLREFGFTNPVLIDSGDNIIAGHGRVMAALQEKMTEIPCIILKGLSDTQRKAYVIADNKLALNAGWNNDLLRAEIIELQDDDYDISLLGFDDGELSELIPDEPVVGLNDEDYVPDVPDVPVSVLGDVWLLGDHRLMCGDSTDHASVMVLLNGVTPDLCYTDPPYGINEKGDRTNRGSGSGCDNSNLPDFKDDSIEYGVKAFNIIQDIKITRQVWWGANYYAHHIPQTNNWFVWDKRVDEKHKDTQSDCELAWVKSKWSSIRIFRHIWKGMIKDSEHGVKRVHPTQKPVALAEWAFDYYKGVETVIDLFGGSGSTLIACEKTGRKNFTMEFEPYYVDVIIKRWQDFTGQQAILEGNDKTFTEISNER